MNGSKFGKIGILYGGPSSEREISLKSGEEVFRALKEEGLSAVLLDAKNRLKEKITDEAIDIAFVALHGKFGEDGTVQRMLEELGIPYTGSGIRASAYALNKSKAKQVFLNCGIPTPDFEVVNKPVTRIALPFVVKPRDEGSTLGVSIVFDEKDFARALEEAQEFGDEVLVETYIPGHEVTCAVLGNDDAFALPPIEIVPQDKFFTFASKYTDGGARHFMPPRLPEAVCEEIKEISVCAHRALACQGVSRADLMVENKKKIWLLEVNTIPGLTSGSLVPEAAGAAGISKGKLCIRLLELAEASRRRALCQKSKSLAGK